MSEIIEEERARRLGKLRKCLALSRSPEPHEAAAAMRQAQKLMAQLGVSREEAEAPEIESALVKTREGFGRCYFMAALSGLVERCFGVHSVFERNPGTADRLNVRYLGPAGRAKLAEYVHRVILRAVDDAWAAHLEGHPHHKGQAGRRTSFRLGWLDEVSKQVEDMAPTELEAAAIARWQEARYGAALVVIKADAKTDLAAQLAGMEAAQGFQLHRAVPQERLRLTTSEVR